MTGERECPYCHLQEGGQDPIGGWVHSDEHWLVGQGPAETTMPGALKIISRRHFIDFAEMTPDESASFGALLTRLDTALRATTDAERVHLVSTRDRVQHFHAWLYPRPASHALRGTAFLNAPQHSDPADAAETARAVRDHLDHTITAPPHRPPDPTANTDNRYRPV
ncbi:HIT family protein [Streptosporangium sp. NPDC049376]|uniref:HIT family protein n=1 Tax=Streptosporangium sp. NPDC049376 TaxID=3366192 RepID=UPI0037B6BF3F